MGDLRDRSASVLSSRPGWVAMDGARPAAGAAAPGGGGRAKEIEIVLWAAGGVASLLLACCCGSFALAVRLAGGQHRRRDVRATDEEAAPGRASRPRSRRAVVDAADEKEAASARIWTDEVKYY